MKRRRSIAASPVRSASEAWATVVALLADTLERSPSIPDGSVRAELEVLDGLGPALIAAGHLETDRLVLVDSGLHLTIDVLIGDRALEVQENLNPVPGGTSATGAWTLYVPRPAPLASIVAVAVAKSKHLSDKSPPESAPDEEKSERKALIDLDALRRLGRQP